MASVSFVPLNRRLSARPECAFSPVCPPLWIIGAATICIGPAHVDWSDFEGNAFEQEELAETMRNEELKWAYLCLVAILCVLLIVAGITLYLTLRLSKKS